LVVTVGDNVNLAEDSAVTFDERSNDRGPDGFSILVVSGIDGSAIDIGSPVAGKNFPEAIVGTTTSRIAS